MKVAPAGGSNAAGQLSGTAELDADLDWHEDNQIAAETMVSKGLTK
eukprot:gene11736-37519_t